MDFLVDIAEDLMLSHSEFRCHSITTRIAIHKKAGAERVPT